MLLKEFTITLSVIEKSTDEEGHFDEDSICEEIRGLIEGHEELEMQSITATEKEKE